MCQKRGKVPQFSSHFKTRMVAQNFHITRKTPKLPMTILTWATPWRPLSDHGNRNRRSRRRAWSTTSRSSSAHPLRSLGKLPQLTGTCAACKHGFVSTCEQSDTRVLRWSSRQHFDSEVVGTTNSHSGSSSWYDRLPFRFDLTTLFRSRCFAFFLF